MCSPGRRPMDFCADAITRWQHSSHLNAQSEQTPPRRIAIVSGEDELHGPVLRGAPKADALATGVCVINPVGSETEHKWFLLWHPGRRQSRMRRKWSRKGRLSLLPSWGIASVASARVLRVLYAHGRPRSRSDSATQPSHTDTPAAPLPSFTETSL